jgi:hypothetical protein
MAKQSAVQKLEPTRRAMVFEHEDGGLLRIDILTIQGDEVVKVDKGQPDLPEIILNKLSQAINHRMLVGV